MNKKELSIQQRAILQALKSGEFTYQTVDLKSLSESLSVTKEQVDWALKVLNEKGRIRKTSKGKGQAAEIEIYD